MVFCFLQKSSKLRYAELLMVEPKLTECRAKPSAVHNCSSTNSHDKQRIARGNPNSCLMLPLKPNSLEQSQPLMQVAIIQLRDYLIDLCHISPVRALTSIHTWYLSFFLHEQNFWRIKFTPKKRINYDKIHSKLPIFCVITVKYTVNCQFFALNL